MSSTFSYRLKQALDKTGTPKSKLALMVGTTPSTVTGWLNGKLPTISNLISISRSLNISLCWLINGLGPMHMYGPLHVSPDEENLILQLRFFPSEISKHLLQFLAAACQHESDAHLINCARASRILNTVEIAMIVIDQNYRIKDANNAFLDLLNVNSDNKQDLINTSFIDWLETKDKGQLILQCGLAKKTGFLESVHCKMIQVDRIDMISVIFSGAYHGSQDDGFFLMTAFLLPQKNR